MLESSLIVCNFPISYRCMLPSDHPCPNVMTQTSSIDSEAVAGARLHNVYSLYIINMRLLSHFLNETTPTFYPKFQLRTMLGSYELQNGPEMNDLECKAGEVSVNIEFFRYQMKL